MSITTELLPEWEKQLERKAACGLDVATYLQTLIANDTGIVQDSRTALEESVRQMKSRSPAERAAMREQLLATARPAQPLPHGKTLEQVIIGQWPGDESDETIDAALRELS